MRDRCNTSSAVAAVVFVTTGATLAASEVFAQDAQPVSVIAFPGTGNWPIRIAQEKGYFAQNRIEVTLSPTPSSVFQMTSLIAGKFDIAMTAADNVIAYLEGQGEAPVSGQPDLFMFMGGSPSMPALVTVPEIKTYAELEGKTLAVDALTTGYAFVLFDLLKRNGLQLGDYKVEISRRYTGALARHARAQICCCNADVAVRSNRQCGRFSCSTVRQGHLWTL